MHLRRVQGFCFALLQYSPIQAFTVAFVLSMQFTANVAKQRTGLYRGFSRYFPCFAAVVWRVHPPIPHHPRRSASSTYQNHRHARTLYSSAQPPYYNKVYKGASLLWIHARQCSISQTMPARRGHLLPCVDLWQVLHPAHLLRGSASPPVQGQPGGLQSSTGQRSGRTSWYPPPGGAVQQQERGGAARNH